MRYGSIALALRRSRRCNMIRPRSSLIRPSWWRPRGLAVDQELTGGVIYVTADESCQLSERDMSSECVRRTTRRVPEEAGASTMSCRTLNSAYGERPRSSRTSDEGFESCPVRSIGRCRTYIEACNARTAWRGVMVGRLVATPGGCARSRSSLESGRRQPRGTRVDLITSRVIAKDLRTGRSSIALAPCDLRAMLLVLGRP